MQKIDGFPGTHGTHANGATVTADSFLRPPTLKASNFKALYSTDPIFTEL